MLQIKMRLTKGLRMSGIAKLTKYVINIFCWLVKGVGLAVLLLLLAIFIGEGPPNPFKLTARQLLLMVGFLVTWVGMALALWRQLIGGIVILGSIAGFTFVFGVHQSWLFYTFWLIGLLNILCWWLKKLQGNGK